MSGTIIKIVVALSALSLFLILISGCAEKQEGPIYTDPKGRFSVEAPSGWRIQRLRGDGSKVVFYKVKNNITVAAEEYDESKTISEKEKNRVRSALEAAIPTRFGGGISDIWEESIIIDGVEGWVYGFSIPREELKLKMVMFVKNGKIHTILSTCSSEQEETLDRFLSSFKSTEGK